MSNMIYLDNASTTFKPQCVIDAINNYLSCKYKKGCKKSGCISSCFRRGKSLSDISELRCFYRRTIGDLATFFINLSLVKDDKKVQEYIKKL